MDRRVSNASKLHSISSSTITGMRSTTVSIHAMGYDQTLSTPLGEQPTPVTDYQSIQETRESTPLAVKPTKRKSYLQKGTLSEHLVYFCALSVASYFGVVSRIYLATLAQWNGVPLFPSLYPEMVGTAIMGFISLHKKLLQVKHAAFYQAVATGLCGSITTFSSWNSEAVSTLLQIDQDPIDNATRFIAWFTTIFLGFGMPVAALCFGKHIAYLSPWNDTKMASTEDNKPSKKLVIAESVFFVAAWIVLSIIGIAVPYVVDRYDLLFSIVFSAFGTYIRWHLSPLNNVFKQFRLGTFVVNVFGSWLLGAVAVSQAHLISVGAREQDITYSILTGLGTGFCGCLTTVSTFAVELTTLSPRGTYFYALSSIVVAQAGLVVIRGTYEWTN